MIALNPIQRMWVAVGAYCLPRWLTVIRWWKNRATNKFAEMKRAFVTPDPETTDGKVHPKAEPQERDFVS
jgi:hypothetical protein